MADEPIAVEPTDDVAPEPVVEPDATPEPEPQPVIEPDWLDAPVSPEPAQQQYQQPPQYTPQQQQAYNQQQQYMQQAPQVPDVNDDLNRFVQDPRTYTTEVARQEAAMIAQQQLAQQLGPINAQMNAYMESQLAMQTSEADNAIRSMYQNEFNKDEVFVGDKRVQAELQNTLSGLRQSAEYQARMGNPRALLMFQQPGFANVALAAVKAALGATGGAVAPAGVPHVESTSPTATPSSGVQADPDTVEALRQKFGDSYVERYMKEFEKEGQRS